MGERERYERAERVVAAAVGWHPGRDGALPAVEDVPEGELRGVLGEVAYLAGFLVQSLAGSLIAGTDFKPPEQDGTFEAVDWAVGFARELRFG